MKVLVTGSAGYVGSAVAARLLERGHEVTGYDLADGCDISDSLQLARVLPRVDVVIHCAARTLVPESFRDPGGYWDVNLGGTYTLLNAARKAGVRRVVISSTAAVYGEPEPGRVPVGEDHPTRPASPYGASKLAADHLLASFAAHHNFAAASLRYFNVAGAHQAGSGWLGERHDPETHLIPLALNAAAEGFPVHVYGGEYPTRDGTCVRDYIHVTDLADAHLKALYAIRAGEHKTWNLGSGKGWTVREVIEMCRIVTGLDIAEARRVPRDGDPAVLVAANDRARADLGWEPGRGMEAIVRDAWAFMQQEGHAGPSA
jgi:UDP-glucose 4-epimerase